MEISLKEFFSISGRILNRFAKDTSLIDDMLPFSSFQITQVCLKKFTERENLKHFGIICENVLHFTERLTSKYYNLC